MWDIGWRSIAVGLVFLLDLIVFADLVRADLSDLRTTWVVIKRGRVPTASFRPPSARAADRSRTAAPPEGVRSSPV